MIDLHAHVLPGLDDGVRSLGEALELVAAAAAEGVTAIAATPHVRDDYPTSPGRMERAVGELREAVAEAGLGVDILCGGEIALERLWLLDADELRRFTLAQTGRYLLVEAPYTGWPPLVERSVSLLTGRGIRPLIAHPERNPIVQDRPETVEPLVAAGALVQVTAASLDGRLGAAPALAARILLDRGLVHVLASDAHAPQVRAVGLEAAAEAVGDSALAHRLTSANPAAIVAGEDLPS
jgi:protein-tyrosine phosphatase